MRIRELVTADMVKAECKRRILLRYDLGKQNTIILRANEATTTMHKFIEDTIAASHRLEATLPPDYRHDRHWPPAP